MATNCYLISHNDKSIVIDPCVDYKTVFRNEESKIQGIIITHGHFDHFNALGTYLKETDVKIYMHKRCLEKLIDPVKNCSVYCSCEVKFDIPNERIIFVNENSVLDLLDKKIKIIETPGHTDCSICVLIDEAIFSGDTLFKESIGRTDLYSSNSAKMIDSIEKLKKLKVNYQVYPGHSDKTTLDYEKEFNPYMNRS
jgi:glyoxylase-like metal-dependent hydrolase (beta-lactamase superfamily II)